MEKEDFILAMENFDEFINGDIIEDKDSKSSYPIGLGIHGERIHFVHYESFESAIKSWNKRKVRIDKNNMAILITKYFDDIKEDKNDDEIIRRFDNLPFKNKLIFADESISGPNIISLKGYSSVRYSKNIYRTSNVFGKRYIDQFDYISFINSLKNNIC